VKSRRPILLIFFAILLFVIPATFYEGEHTFCETEHASSSKIGVQAQEVGTVAFDQCNMIDFGMFPWMRYSFVGGFVILLAGAFSFSADKRART
jgi:hypothetical protein